MEGPVNAPKTQKEAVEAGKSETVSTKTEKEETNQKEMESEKKPKHKKKKKKAKKAKKAPKKSRHSETETESEEEVDKKKEGPYYLYFVVFLKRTWCIISAYGWVAAFFSPPTARKSFTKFDPRKPISAPQNP